MDFWTLLGREMASMTRPIHVFTLVQVNCNINCTLGDWQILGSKDL